MLKTTIFTAVFTCLIHHVSAQAPFQFMKDGNGRPLFIQSNYIAEGAPYFNEEYEMAQITALNGTVYSNVGVKKFIRHIFEDGQTGELILASYSSTMYAADGQTYQVLIVEK